MFFVSDNTGRPLRNVVVYYVRKKHIYNSPGEYNKVVSSKISII